MSDRCPDCGWPTPTGACGRCNNEARETMRAYNANHCPACSDFRPCGASWTSPAEVLTMSDELPRSASDRLRSAARATRPETMRLIEESQSLTDRPKICPHPSYHNVCDACVREYREREAGR